MIVAVLWAFGAFLYFKIGLDFAFYREISVLGALLLGVMVGISAFAASYYYAVHMGTHLARVRFGGPSSFFKAALKIWILMVIADIAVAKGIVFGFSKNLNNELGGDLLFRGRSYTDEGLLFSVLVIVPITLHFVSVLYAVGVQSKTVQRLDQSE